MNEPQLRRLLRRLVLLSAPLPLAVLGAACGGASTLDSSGDGGTTAQGGKDMGGAGKSHAGDGSGGSSAGAGGDVVVGTGGGISSAGAGGSIHLGGAGGGGAAGAGGASNQCSANPPSNCAPAPYTIPKGCIPIGQAVVGTALLAETCQEICFRSDCAVSAVEATTITVMCQPACAVGRRPAGLGEPSTCDTRAAGSYFAEMAHLEAASVTAFRILRDELRASGAPKKLVRAAARAARDEIRHARATGALARRFGATPRLPAIEPAKARSLEAMALENAVEGCVRETYGALVATRQAQAATDPVVRTAMLRIARDETRHAALSWRVRRWLDTRLDPAARRKVTHATQTAAAELVAALANEPEVAFANLAGLPTPAEATRLATEMQRALWS